MHSMNKTFINYMKGEDDHQTFGVSGGRKPNTY